MDSERSTPAKPSRAPGVTFLVWSLVIVLIGYPLSRGPALALSVALYGNSAHDCWIEKLYVPLHYAYQHIPAVQAFYNWYLPLWVKPPY